jgi:hypothetical protein
MRLGRRSPGSASTFRGLVDRSLGGALVLVLLVLASCAGGSGGPPTIRRWRKERLGERPPRCCRGPPVRTRCRAGAQVRKARPWASPLTGDGWRWTKTEPCAAWWWPEVSSGILPLGVRVGVRVTAHGLLHEEAMTVGFASGGHIGYLDTVFGALTVEQTQAFSGSPSLDASPSSGPLGDPFGLTVREESERVTLEMSNTRGTFRGTPR